MILIIDYYILVPFIGFCILCIKDLFPFSDISDQELAFTFSSDVIIDFCNIPSSLNLFPTTDQNNYFNKFNDLFVSKNLDCEGEVEDTSNVIKCKYYNVDDFCASNFDSSNSFSVFHLNISSLKAHFDELNTMLNLLNFDFSIIGLTETKKKKIFNLLYHFLLKDIIANILQLNLLAAVLFYICLIV